VPTASDWAFNIPREFFFHGWVHVLYPSEIATWLTLRFLRERFPGSHDASGVYLYGREREENFHLLRDTYEDSCKMLQALSLLRPAEPIIASPPTVPGTTGSDSPGDPQIMGPLPRVIDFANIPSGPPERYEPHRWQLTDEGLRKDALAECLAQLAFQRKNRADRS